MPQEQPPALPGTLSRPDAQRIIDALNLRLHGAEQSITELEEKAVVVGRVSAAGGALLGSGFAVEKTATGIYKITLTNELPTEGVLTATCVSNNNLPRVAESGKKVFRVSFVTLGEIAQDCSFNFAIKAN